MDKDNTDFWMENPENVALSSKSIFFPMLLLKIFVL